MQRERFWVFAVSGLSLSLFAACAETDVIGRSEGRLEAQPALVDFGEVPVAYELERTLELVNVGDGPVDATARIEGPGSEFVAIANAQVRMQAGTRLAMTLSFAPEQIGALQAELVIVEDEVTILRVPVKGTPVDRPFIVEPASVDFGNVRRGLVGSRSLTVRNVLDVPINVEMRPIEGLRAGEFRFEGATRTIALLPRAQATITVLFGPVELGMANARFTLEGDCTFSCRQLITLQGVAVESSLECAPAVADFGAINPGDCITRTVDCHNPLDRPIQVRAMAIEPPTPELSTPTPVPIVVAGGDTQSIALEYCPGDLGQDRARLQLATREHDDRAGMLSIQLLGEGGGPNIVATQRTVSLGAPVGGAHRRRVLIDNVGYSPLEIRDIYLEGGNGPITLSSARAPLTVVPGGSEVVEFEFRPVDESEVTAQLVIVSNDADEAEIRVPITALGLAAVPCEIEVTPGNINFGLVEVGSSTTKILRVRAPGTERCAFFEPRMERGTIFRVSARTPVSGHLEPSQSLDIELLYAPVAQSPLSGDEDAFFIDAPNATPSTVRVPVHGIAAPSELAIHPNPVDFETVQVGFGRHRTITIYNVGSTPRQITGISRVAGSSVDFTFTSTPTLPRMIPAGESFAVDVRYLGLSEGSDFGSVAIEAAGLPTAILVDLRAQARNDNCGHITGNICRPSGEGPSIGARVVVETASGDTIETVTDESGTFYLYCVPPGQVDIQVARGHFSTRERVEVTAYTTTELPAPVCLEAASANIAVVTGYYDTVQDILGDLNVPFETHNGMGIAPAFLTTPGALDAYDILFFNCGFSDSHMRDPVVAANIQAFVARGGSIYASDWAYDSVEGAFPNQIEFLGPDGQQDAAQQGFESPLEGRVLDPAILEQLGGQTSVTLTYAGGYAVVDSAAPTTLVHVVGETLGPGTGLKPLLVSFQLTPTSGRVMYTTFHNADVFLDAGMRIVLEHLVFEL